MDTDARRAAGTERAVPLVSIVIPVFNDAQRLHLCLDALERQTYAGDRYEVVVVDNGSDQSLDHVVGKYPHARLAYERRRSSYAARNQGIHVANGEILGFTDSDCIPAENWIAQAVERMYEAPQCGILAGKVEVFSQPGRRPNPVELYEQLYGFPQEEYVRKWRFGVTANIFTFDYVLETVGLFSDRLESGGDYEWGQRVASAGYSIAYTDDVRVAHPARRSLRQIRTKIIRVVNGIEQMKSLPPKSPGASEVESKVPEISENMLKQMLRSVGKVWSSDLVHGVDQRLQVLGVVAFAGFMRRYEILRLRIARTRETKRYRRTS